VSRGNYLFTSESVSEGHPDKVCDRISDAVVDLYLAADPRSRVACETLVTTNRIVLAGEVRGPASVSSERIEKAARNAVREIGYEQEGFHWDLAEFQNYLHEQSADIAMGVDADVESDKDEGAGDQGIMFGFACRETEPLMPAPIYYAHRLLHEMAKARHAGRTPELGPDSKSQVTLVYEDGKPVRADSVVVSTQHDEAASSERVEEIVKGFVDEVMPKGWVNGSTKFYVNPTGRFVIGGPDGDTGLTAAARFPARTPRRWTVRPPMPRAISPRTWWQRG
jgi:S-adenosylmethionine synthetase